MPIQPVNFDIPPVIQLGLDAGKLVRYGGVVRNQLGHIVAHLTEAPVPGKESAAVQSVASLFKDRRVAIVVVLGTATGGAFAVLAVKHQVQARKCVKNLNASLVAYLKSARDGALDARALSRLIADLDAAEAYTKNGRVSVASELVQLVFDYTNRLTEVNSVDVSELRADTPESDAGTVVDLRRHLEVQRKIFRETA